MNIREIRLISKFMGWTTHIRTNHWISTDVEEYDNIKLPERLSWINDGYINIKSAEFDKSWDWLMPVVEKIQSIYETDEYFGVLIDICTTHVKISIVEEGFTTTIDLKFLDGQEPITKTEAVCQAVVEFIEWYNDTKPLNENQILGQSTII